MKYRYIVFALVTAALILSMSAYGGMQKTKPHPIKDSFPSGVPLAKSVKPTPAHADREKEHAEQEPFERIDGRLDGAMILGLRQQQPGDKGAERHGQSRGRACKAAADGDQ